MSTDELNGSTFSLPAPGFPHPDSSLSFWLQGARASPLFGHRTTEAIPDSAGVIIIGAGISGAATAYFMLTGPSPPKSVVILEAKEACYGATGRNGGHCRPDCYRGYPVFKASFGKEQAMKIIENEMENLNLLTEVIEQEKIDCDLWRGPSIDVAMDQECADFFQSALEEFRADGGRVDGIVEWISDKEEAKKRTRCPSAQGAAVFPAGSLYPYKLVTQLLKLCIDKHRLNLQTNTPVIAVSPSSEGWSVDTDRGSIQASQVIYASNAFTSTLLPEFRGKISPIRGQCSAVVPTKAYSGSQILGHTCSLRWGSFKDYDYLIQRPKDGIIIIGGGRRKVPKEQLVGQTDDSVKLGVITEHLREACKGYFEGWGDEVIGEGLLCDWMGIMGHTPDGVPYVGPIHEKPGAFIIGGHCGHGMARAMTCARGIAALIRGEPWSATGLPECFQPTPERLAKYTQSVEQQRLGMEPNTEYKYIL